MAQDRILGCAAKCVVSQSESDGRTVFTCDCGEETCPHVSAVLQAVGNYASGAGWWSCEEGDSVRLTSHGVDLALAWRKRAFGADAEVAANIVRAS